MGVLEEEEEDDDDDDEDEASALEDEDEFDRLFKGKDLNEVDESLEDEMYPEEEKVLALIAKLRKEKANALEKIENISVDKNANQIVNEKNQNTIKTIKSKKDSKQTKQMENTKSTKSAKVDTMEISSTETNRKIGEGKRPKKKVKITKDQNDDKQKQETIQTKSNSTSSPIQPILKEAKKKFIKSSKFAGSKKGYFFKKGKLE